MSLVKNIQEILGAAPPSAYDYTSVEVGGHLKTAAVSMNQVSRLLDPEAHEVYGKLLPVIRELQYAAESAGDHKLGHLFGQAVTYMTGRLK